MSFQCECFTKLRNFNLSALCPVSLSFISFQSECIMLFQYGVFYVLFI